MDAGDALTPEDILRHADEARPWPLAPGQAVGADVAHAYQMQLALRALRIARGERPLGFKVGFTNRGIWPRYGVYGPIWGTMWDRTVRHCPSGQAQGQVDLRGCCQPRIEPECVFGLRATPPAGASLQQLFDCIDWVAPGFEIVQSHLADWKFIAADTVADGALHARALVGPRVPVATLGGNADALDRRLAQAQVLLHRDGQEMARGSGANVLDSPLRALQHFLGELRACPGAPELQPGDIVTTGTWTDAYAVAAGEAWQATFSEGLGELTVHFSAG